MSLASFDPVFRLGLELIRLWVCGWGLANLVLLGSCGLHYFARPPLSGPPAAWSWRSVVRVMDPSDRRVWVRQWIGQALMVVFLLALVGDVFLGRPWGAAWRPWGVPVESWFASLVAGSFLLQRLCFIQRLRAVLMREVECEFQQALRQQQCSDHARALARATPSSCASTQSRRL